MIYRKAPARPTKLLLKIVAVGGALASVACGGLVDGGCGDGHVCGSLPATCDTDAGDACGEDAGGGLIGFVAADAGPNVCLDDAGNPTCGLLPTTVDGGANDE